MGIFYSKKEEEKRHDESLYNLILTGPHMSGKHTQAYLLTNVKEAICHIRASDMMKKEIDKDTSIGRKLIQAQKKGGNATDDIVLDLVERKIDSKECRSGFVITDFPTSVPLAEKLDKFLKERERKINTVLYLDVKRYALADRFMGCMAHPPSGRRYHEDFAPPEKPRIDNITGKPLSSCIPGTTLSTLDSENREYKKMMSPVLGYYNKQNKLHTLDGDRRIVQVLRMVIACLKNDIITADGEEKLQKIEDKHAED